MVLPVFKFLIICAYGGFLWLPAVPPVLFVVVVFDHVPLWYHSLTLDTDLSFWAQVVIKLIPTLFSLYSMGLKFLMPGLYAAVISLKASLERFLLPKRALSFWLYLSLERRIRKPGVYALTFGWEESEVQNTGCFSVGITIVHNVGDGVTICWVNRKFIHKTVHTAYLC